MFSLVLSGKLKRYFEQQEREAYLKKYGFDTKCPCCKTWQGNCGGIIGHQDNYPDDNHYAYRCGQCKSWVIMDARGMISTPAGDQTAAKQLNEAEIKRALDVPSPTVSK